MGVVNVTPDSFSDGGVHLAAADAVAAGRRMLAEGAAIVDVGGESTRPGVGRRLRRRGAAPRRPGARGARAARRSRSTRRRRRCAARAIELGAELVNDVTALRGDPELAGVVADAGVYLCLMHMHGEPRTMQDDPRYDDVVSEVAAFLEQRLAFAVAAGVPEERVCLDPGFGFGKTVEHNLELLRRLDEIAALGRPVLVGLSRKRSLGRLLGDPEATVGSAAASVGAAVAALDRGATIFRVHDVRAHVEALTVRGRCVAHDARRAARPRDLRLPRRQRAREGATASRSSTTSSSRSATRASPTGSRRRSTTATSRRRCASSRRGAASTCSRRSRPRSPTRCSRGSRRSSRSSSASAKTQLRLPVEWSAVDGAALSSTSMRYACSGAPGSSVAAT